MKFIVLFFFIALTQSLSDARFHQKEEHNQLSHNNSHLDCFDVFIPLINRLSSEAKEIAEKCVSTANSQKEREIAAIKSTRTELYSEVKRIKDTLTVCSARNDHVGYFECLNGIVESDRKIVGSIVSKSSKYERMMKEIQEQEIKCFRESVGKVKEKNSYAINSLQYCLTSSGNSVGSEVVSTTPYLRYHHGTTDYDDYSYGDVPSSDPLGRSQSK